MVLEFVASVARGDRSWCDRSRGGHQQRRLTAMGLNGSTPTSWSNWSPSEVAARAGVGWKGRLERRAVPEHAWRASPQQPRRRPWRWLRGSKPPSSTASPRPTWDQRRTLGPPRGPRRPRRLTRRRTDASWQRRRQPGRREPAHPLDRPDPLGSRLYPRAAEWHGGWPGRPELHSTRWPPTVLLDLPDA